MGKYIHTDSYVFQCVLIQLFDVKLNLKGGRVRECSTVNPKVWIINDSCTTQKETQKRIKTEFECYTFLRA